jgi:hypothetical protein
VCDETCKTDGGKDLFLARWFSVAIGDAGTENSSNSVVTASGSPYKAIGSTHSMFAEKTPDVYVIKNITTVGSPMYDKSAEDGRFVARFAGSCDIVLNVNVGGNNVADDGLAGGISLFHYNSDDALLNSYAFCRYTKKQTYVGTGINCVATIEIGADDYMTFNAWSKDRYGYDLEDATVDVSCN